MGTSGDYEKSRPSISNGKGFRKAQIVCVCVCVCVCARVCAHTHVRERESARACVCEKEQKVKAQSCSKPQSKYVRDPARPQCFPVLLSRSLALGKI